jgi:hypothetical protein
MRCVNTRSTGLGRAKNKFSSFEKKITATWANRKRQGRRWLTPRSRHSSCRCQEIFKRIWSHLHVQLSRAQQGPRRSRHRSVRGTSILPLVLSSPICISSMRPTTACSVVKDASTVTATNSLLTPTTSRVSGGISMLSRAQQVSFSPSSC